MPGNAGGCRSLGTRLVHMYARCLMEAFDACCAPWHLAARGTRQEPDWKIYWQSPRRRRRHFSTAAASADYLESLVAIATQ